MQLKVISESNYSKEIKTVIAEKRRLGRNGEQARASHDRTKINKIGQLL